MHHCGSAASLRFDADVAGWHLGFGLHIKRDEVGHRKVGTSVAFGDAALRSSARHRCTTFACRLYSLATAAAEASGCRHASRTSALNRALCLRRVARLTTPSIASTSFIADTMPADSQAIKMTSPCAYEQSRMEGDQRALQASPRDSASRVGRVIPRRQLCGSLRWPSQSSDANPACSKAKAAASTVASSKCRPTNIMPTGSAPTRPQGTLMAGCPVASNEAVLAIMLSATLR